MSAAAEFHRNGPASLASLPRKLKERIVAHLDHLALYVDDDGWEDDASGEEPPKEVKDKADVAVEAGDEEATDLGVDLFDGPEDQRRATLSALSLVSKEWYALVAPFIWRDLWLYARSTESLLELAKDILPRQAEHVKQLCLRESQFDTLLADDQGDSLPIADGHALEVVEAVEKLVRVEKVDALEWELRCARARSALLAHIVGACPNVRELDIEGSMRIFRRSTWDTVMASEDETPTPVEVAEEDVANTALQSIKALGNKLERLALLLPPDGVSTEQDATDFLEAYPALKSLELNVFVLENGRDAATVAAQRQGLIAALSKLDKLEELILGRNTFVNDDLTGVAFSAPLKHLELGESPDLSFAAFATFVQRFSSTLESLELDGTPAAASEQVDPLDLPKLVALEIATQLEASILQLFAKAPLRVVFIRESPKLVAKDVVAFFEAHKNTLVSVDLEEDAIADEGADEDDDDYQPAEEVVGKWCEKHGVEFALVESDDLELEESDDDDDEGDEAAN